MVLGPLAATIAWLSGLLLLPAAIYLPPDHRAWPGLLAITWLALLAGFSSFEALLYWPLLPVLLPLLWSRRDAAGRVNPDGLTVAGASSAVRSDLQRRLLAIFSVAALLVSWLVGTVGSAAGLPTLPADVPVRAAGVTDLWNDLEVNRRVFLYAGVWLAIVGAALFLRLRGASSGREGRAA